MPWPSPSSLWHGRAEDPVTLLAAFEYRTIHGERHLLGELARGLTRGEELVRSLAPLTSVAARDRAGDQRPRRRAVIEKIAGRIRLVLRLVVHLAAAAAQETSRREPDARADQGLDDRRLG